MYADKEFPARRREIKATTSVAGAKVMVKRSSANLLLYDAQTGGTEQFANKDEVALTADTSYWLQAGSTPSASVRDHWLKARQDKADSAVEDEVRFTVVWVEISGRNSDKLSQPPIYDGYQNVLAQQGHDSLGVVRSTAKSTDKEFRSRGNIEVRGKISPNNFSFVGGDSEGFQNTFDPKTKESKSSARFGFVFKRKSTTKAYRDGNYEKKPFSETSDLNDDSSRDFQDVQPSLDKDELLIVDHDGPTLWSVLQDQMFTHVRYNFVEKVVFHFEEKLPERASKTLKWAFTGDAAAGYDAKLVFILGKANEKKDYNSVLVGENLASLDVSFAKPTVNKAYNLATKDQKLKRGKLNTIVVEGKDLIGFISLGKKGEFDIVRNVILVKNDAKDSQFGDLTEMWVQFNVNKDQPIGANWDLVILNSQGEVSFPGFEITD